MSILIGAAEKPVSAAAPSEARGRRRAPRDNAKRTVWHVVLVLVSAAFVAPLAWMIVTSLRSSQTALTGPILPRSFTLHAYAYVFSEVGIWRNLLNSIVVTGIAVLLTIAASTLAGYAFGRLGFWGKTATFTLLTSALFLPGVAILIPLYIELQEIGLLGGRTGLILVYAASGIPFSAFLMRAFFEELPWELSEAAKTDGASEFQIFWRVMLPLGAPGVATVATFQIITVWNDLLLGNALISEPTARTLQPAVNSLIGQYATDWPALTAGMTLSAAPMLLAYLLFQRWFVAGLTAGAVKS
jgi:ABC-type glycerol-3-phosphate transport system permease component